VIEVKDKSLEYSIRDVHNGLKGNTVKISLNVEYMPHVGIFSKVTPLTNPDETLLNQLYSADQIYQRKLMSTALFLIPSNFLLPLFSEFFLISIKRQGKIIE
jgi:hypothetical protein